MAPSLKNMSFKKMSRKAGLPPGTLIHTGEKKAEAVKVTVIDYDEAGFREAEVSDIKECFVFRDKATVSWINVEGLHNVGIVEKLGDYYGFHPLALEDILNIDQRPKADDYGEYIYIVLKMFHPGWTDGIVGEQISLILGSNFVISFQEGIKGDVFDAVRQRIRAGKGRIRSMGADYLAYSLMDAIVDNCFIVLEALGEQIEELEEELASRPTSETVRALHRFKREMIFLRKSVWPLREVVNSLEKNDSPLIKEHTRTYLRDLYDHTIHVIDTVETLRDILSGMHDLYLSSISNKMNEIMKFLTIIGTIFIPLTFIAGIYGMNFDFMPELRWRWGYLLVLSVMLSVGVLMLFYFKKKKWL